MKHILIVGDSIIDRYWYCNPKDISPEAPVINWTTEDIFDAPGGAANVASSLGALVKILKLDVKVSFVSGITKELLGCIPEHFPSILSVYSPRLPTIKNRIIYPSPHQQIIRFDQDNNDPPTSVEENEMIRTINSSYYDVALVSDYSHGGVTTNLLAAIRRKSRLVIIDPKGSDPLKYKGFADILTPNMTELVSLTSGIPSESKIDQRVKFLQHRLQTYNINPTIILKRSEEGCRIYNGKELVEEFPAWRGNKSYLDPTGAGDCFIASLALDLATNIPLTKAVDGANFLAGISVTYPNCWVPTLEGVKNA